jgi:cellulose synthase/poly-beta-1,6-N-acetylglucosamine synthase-like glycosyltransferase
MAADPTPLVSVVIPTRNRPGLLRPALASVAAQTFDRFEALVIDDGSDEATLKAYDDLWAGLDGRFVLHRQPVPGLPGTGPSAVRNRGVRLARGEFVAFLDDDDYWEAPDHLAVAVQALRRHNADYYFAKMQTVRAGEVILPDWYPDSPQLTAGPRVEESPAVYGVTLPAILPLFRHFHIHLDCSVIRRSLLEELGCFCERIRYGEDYHLALRVAAASRRTLYRPDLVATYVVPQGPSASRIPVAEQGLQMIAVCQHVRATCDNPLVRRCARAREAWNYRVVAEALLQDGRGGAAALAWQALCLYPTAGGAVALARACADSLARSLGWRKQPLKSLAS